MGWGEQNRELNGPEDQVTDHLLGGDADRRGDVVGNVKIRWPDRSDHLGDSSGASVCLNGVPEKSGGHTSDDSKFGEVPTERRAHGDGERDMETSSKHTVQHERDSAA